MKIITVLHSRPADVLIGRQSLADECGCDRRTIQRDIELLILADIPITYDRSRRTYLLENANGISPIAATTAEDVLALALARAALSPPGLPYASTLRRAIDKTSSALPSGLKDLLEQARQIIQAGAFPRDYSGAPIELLTLAASTRRTMEIDYESFSSRERRWRMIDPYKIHLRAGVYWEVHGWCHRREVIRTFALNRIHGARLAEGRFTRREEEWERFWREKGVYGGLRGGEPAQVRVRFAPPVVEYALAFAWPDGLSIEAQEDGFAILTGETLGVDGILTDLLSWRRYAEVLGGDLLRRKFIEELRAMTLLYEAKP